MPRGIGVASTIFCLCLVPAGSTEGTEEVAAAESVECAVCHVEDEQSLLTDQGRYFQYLGTLDGFEAVIDRFGSCSYCHVQEADSVELTREGVRFRWMMEDMEGLKAWLEENHPQPAEGD